MKKSNNEKIKTIVIKLSSNLLNPSLNSIVIEKLSKEIALLKKKGHQVIIVTSGAVMYGLRELKITTKPESLPLLQSAASIGQIKLMSEYQSIFAKHNIITAQLLVSTDDFSIRKRYLNLRNTVESLLELGTVPVFNENDTINTEELKFGDNDHLSALITIMINFNMLIILTNVDGLFDKDPTHDKGAKLINEISDFNDSHLKYAGANISKFSSGGMKTKLESSYKATQAGIKVYIGNGFKISLLKILNHEETGTYIEGKITSANARKKWLGLAPSGVGIINVDEGAFKALKSNSSLLASGITSVEGNFDRGSLITIYFSNKKVAQGLSNYSSGEINLIKGKQSSDFQNYFDSFDYKEIIHKNNLFLF